ncbi:hypothetical protein XENOCAPTIV_004188 [Xenoophorus captivus]|uniref:Cystatin domain-containing protein n=1 Tax=Xenoophorus captivus TaxID=1517983 RepID=A0ABV0QYE7_9TELE
MWKTVVIFISALVAVEGAMVGGLTDIEINNEGVQNALDFAVAQHNRGTNDVFLSQAAKVVKAQVQVVSGLKYFITVQMEKTSCRKGRANEQCDPLDKPANRPYQCTFIVWSRPWINDIRLIEEKC